MAVGAKDSAQPSAPRTLTNFGGNQTWQARYYRPRNEADVLEILNRHSQEHVRPLGAGHSWSGVVVSPDVALDMSAFDHVRPFEKNGAAFVDVGAGCRLQNLLDRLHATTDQTLPTVGAIKRQTISGAMSTGTHGSGKPSLSHYVASVRLAAYDATTGKAKIFEFREGNPLKAARCALGCMGVILSLELETVKTYMVEETVAWHQTLDEVLALYPECPLTQFILVPYRWAYVAWERKAVEQRTRVARESLKAWLFRIYSTVWIDVAFHLLLKTAVALGPSALKVLFHLLPYLLITQIRRVDDAEHVLTLAHQYFRHEEMELFVPKSRLHEVIRFLRAATEVFAGGTSAVSEDIETKLNLHQLHGDLIRNAGTYVQHYPFFFRRVLPEDTLISMVSRTEEPYSLNFRVHLSPPGTTPTLLRLLRLARARDEQAVRRPAALGQAFPFECGRNRASLSGLATVQAVLPRRRPQRRICQRLHETGPGTVKHPSTPYLGL